MIYAAFFVFFLYAVACLWLCVQWIRIDPRPSAAISVPNDFKLSVVIPVRNEERTIGVLLGDLQRQTLGKIHFEVLVVNDASTDATEEIVNDFQKLNVLDLNIIYLADVAVKSPKKRAITEALKVASGQLIVTTDGDCRVGNKWLETIVQTYLQTNAKFISGPVTFLGEKNGFDIFQTIEFTSLIGTGACLLEAGHPTMCNGANLAYQRAAFDAVGGYEGVDQIASGDDEFLLQKIHQRFPGSSVFMKNQEAIVRTHTQENWRAFYRQRVRWAGKWAVNRRMATMTVALIVFAVNVLTIVFLTAALREGLQNIGLNTILMLKYLPEFIFLGLIISFLRKRTLLWYIPFVQLFYPFYVLLFGLAAQQKGYEWKGRRLR